MAMTSRMFTLKFRIEAAHCEIDSGLRDTCTPGQFKSCGPAAFRTLPTAHDSLKRAGI
jgi:hypothetical protein